MKYTCPVCGYNELPEPPQDFAICPCCGTEFGNDDYETSHEDLRQSWLAQGANWFSKYTNKPDKWDTYKQLV